jgi:hypothetical protein
MALSTLTAYRHLTAQRAYERRIAAFGLPALLSPYTAVKPSIQIPPQRVGGTLWQRLARSS